jgi:hypothetical protein
VPGSRRDYYRMSGNMRDDLLTRWEKYQAERA